MKEGCCWYDPIHHWLDLRLLHPLAIRGGPASYKRWVRWGWGLLNWVPRRSRERRLRNHAENLGIEL